MTIIEKAERKFVDVTLTKLLNYIDKNPQKNLLKIVELAEKLLGGTFPQKNIDAAKKAIESGDGVYYQLAMNVLKDLDREMLKKILLAMGLGAGVKGTKAVRENREKYKCNIPFLLLMDPTSACNCKCKGCWAAEYGNRENLSYEEMASVVSQGKELGTHLYMFTGGEPLIRKNDLIKLCEANPDCAFLAYTNGTLVDEKFCDDLVRVGNMALAISVEGTEESTDDRRGNGMYQKAISAMKLLKEKGCLFGMSVCYTSQNIDMVTSDEFLDKMVELGVKFGLYFNYMPVGHGAPVDLIPQPEQREKMYKWLRRVRNNVTGKPLFIMDFQHDGEFVGGCIAGGRNYFHINAAGDMEPCVFIHFSDSNIREKTLLEGLKSPLFMRFRHDQPFNDNHLRPCPMLENPDCLRDIIKCTKAKSTNLECEETADQLCSKCDKFAKQWAPKAEEIWLNNPHPNPKTQYYRDTPEGKAEFGTN
ncbi:MAG: radical SAM protein [Clostridia bacterium]|nr:radical SAM protein [Clostridia bacterium]